MKTILVPTEPHDFTTATLDAALLLARRFDSYVEGFALRSALAELLAVDPLSAAVLPTVDRDDEEAAQQARRLFESFMRGRGVPRRGGGIGPSFGWLDEAPNGDGFVGSYGRVFDITVVGRPDPNRNSPRMSTLEAALFDSGRPILIAPPTPPPRLGDVVVIAWNGSTETARTVAFALPLLEQAERVVVLTVEGWMVPGPSGEQLARYLRANGIAAEPLGVPAGRRNNGETVLANAAALGCDLLVKGAYTQSRLRQMIFGGATAHILARAEMPVLMAH
jgi:nucleotide-binding universal stress UspA family protein